MGSLEGRVERIRSVYIASCFFLDSDKIKTVCAYHVKLIFISKNVFVFSRGRDDPPRLFYLHPKRVGDPKTQHGRFVCTFQPLYRCVGVCERVHAFFFFFFCIT